jgi:predicted nucleotide-binding protein
MRNGIARLQSRIAALHDLKPSEINVYRSPTIAALETSIADALATTFGHGTPRFGRYHSANDLEPSQNLRIVPDWIGVRSGGFESGVDVQALQKGIAERKDHALALLGQAVHSLEEELTLQESSSERKKTTSDSTFSTKVFLVHGRDDAAKNEVALFLRAIGLDPIILHLQPNGGRHLLTKFTEETEGARFAVVLMIPDDKGGLADAAETERQLRARQNVVFELGFFIGKLGSANVAALLKGNVEKPSDFDGIAYISLDPSAQWKTNLARELHHAKMPFDPAKAFSA